MQIVGVEAWRRGRACILYLIAIIVLLAACDTADARAARKRNVVAQSYSPAYADIVVDANSGAVLHSVAPDATRHPASLTKIMTLYLLFEQLEQGRLKLNTPLPVSVHASSQAPSKLGLKPGQSIVVEDAIKAMVTRSANDVAVVIAEALAGSEDSFAQVMTRKARALGMNRTVYTNASGLPDDAQITTARDQALLGRAIQDRFPQHYKYFATTKFRYAGRTIKGHNRLLGNVAGVDGIKTGYTRASGFNLVTSLRRGNRHLVAVVLGGRTASLRDARMRDLLGDYVMAASTKRTAPMVAEAAIEPATRSPMQRVAAAVIPSAKADPAPTATIPATAAAHAAMPAPAASPPATGIAPGSTDPLQPILVKTLPVKPATIKTASLAPLPTPAPAADLAQAKAAPESAQANPSMPPAPAPGVLGVLPAKIAAASPPPSARDSSVGGTTSQTAHRSGWMIQVGAFDQETEAKRRLASAQSRAKELLGAADPFTERVVKGDKTLYRARFAGLGKDQAEAACKYLKKNEIACMALKN